MTSLRTSLLCLLAMGGLGAAAAQAHLEPITGRVPFIDPDAGVLTAAGTTWGIVVQEADGGWMRTCEEAGGSPFYFFFHRIPDGRILMGRVLRPDTDVGFIQTSDFCTYESVPGPFMDRYASGIDEDANGTLWVMTSGADGVSSVHKTASNDLAFEDTGFVRNGELYFNLFVSPDGLRMISSGVTAETQAPILAFSTDGAVSSDLSAIDLAGITFIRLFGFETPDSVDAVMAATTEDGGFSLRRIVDDFTSLQTILATPRPAVAHAFIAGQRIWALDDGTLWRREELDGGVSDPMEIILDNPIASLMVPQHLEGEVWAGARAADQSPVDGGFFSVGDMGHHFYSTTDGIQWTPQLPFNDVQERICPEDTQSYEQCRRYWPIMDAGVVAPDDGGETPEPDPTVDPTDGGGRVRRDDAGSSNLPQVPDCDCQASATGAGPWWLLGLGCGLTWRSRRRRSRGRRSRR